MQRFPKSASSIRLPPELKAKLEKLAQKQHRTFSNLVIHILQIHMKEIETDEHSST